MIGKIISAIPYGYEGAIIEVEGDSSRGIPALNIVGMANKTIDESRERIRSALVNSLFSFPQDKLTISLAPADLNKAGAYLDLPIALAILIVSSQLLQSEVAGKMFVGELALTGDLRPVRGIINIVEVAKRERMAEVYVPEQNYAQATLVDGIEIVPIKNLKQLFLHLKGVERVASESLPAASVVSRCNTASPRKNEQVHFRSAPNVVKNTETDDGNVILDHIKGQKQAKRALTIAIAGHHNILIAGPPGAGKTMLAKAAHSLLPPLSAEEKIAVTKIHSLAKAADDIVHERPFRSPHHTASTTSVTGGNQMALPGEISLAHLGVLFLDEFPEYTRSVLESLRQPLEDKVIAISRANHKACYPADFMLIATMNPCPCGYLGSSDHECTCTPNQILSYTKKLSGPLLDRIDMVVEVAKVENEDLLRSAGTSRDEHIAARQMIGVAIEAQRARYHRTDYSNSSLSSHQVAKKLKINSGAVEMLLQASKKLGLSARAYFKCIKVAQTIADLESASEIGVRHISEALQYRQKGF